MNKFTKFLYALIMVLVFTAATALGQNSWVNVQFLTDNYSSETSWTITPPCDRDWETYSLYWVC